MICRAISFLMLTGFLLVVPNIHPVRSEPADAYVFITPPMYVAKEIGEIFDIYINIFDVEDLRSVKFVITYNTSLLNVAQVVQESFFPPPPLSNFEFEKKESLGFVKVNMTLVDTETPRSGNGTLARISLEVAQGQMSCAWSSLSLQQTLLLDSALIPIAHDSVGAVYFWKSMQLDPPVEGRSLDVYTQKGGEEPDVSGGEFLVGEVVNLTSRVTYKDDPVQQKLVSFQIRNPLNESVVIRTVITDNDGLAAISFRIPDIPSSIGVWIAISIVEIAEIVTWDTIIFRVYAEMPVGGYAFSIKKHTTENFLTPYLTIVAILTIIFTMIKLKKHKRLRRHKLVVLIPTFILVLMLLGSDILFGINEEGDIMIIDFYSCDAQGIPQDYFPKKTTVYFNVSVRNLAQNPKNVSIYLTVQDALDVPIGSDELDITIPSNVSTCNIMSIFIPKWAYIGVATAYMSVFVEGTFADSETINFHIEPEDLIPPAIHLLFPENVTYRTESIPLVFEVNERTAWMGYILNGLENVTIIGNTTLTGLSNGSYNVMVYANDTSGNAGSSEKVYFTILIIRDVAVIDLKCSSAEAYIGQIVNIAVFVQNEGTVTETFNVTTCANATTIETLTVTSLPPGNQTTIIFAWNTTGFAKGNYTVSAHAEEVLGEIDIADNTYLDSIVNIIPPPDIEVTNIKPSKTLVGQGYSVLISVTVENQGEYIETFNVTLYANTTIIGTTEVTITKESFVTITFGWNTTGFDYGSCAIKAVADVIPGETDIEDNTLVDGSVVVTIPGDVNGDMKVDGKDIAFMVKYFGARIGQANYVPNADVNDDEKIDGKDILSVTKNYGKTIT